MNELNLHPTVYATHRDLYRARAIDIYQRSQPTTNAGQSHLTLLLPRRELLKALVAGRLEFNESDLRLTGSPQA